MEIKEYLQLPYNMVIKKISDESGVYYHATVLELDGCQSTGDTPQEAYDGLREAMEGWIETKLANGYPVPEPSNYGDYSGRISLRLPKSLHRRLAVEARKEGVSLNQHIIYRLAK